MKKIRIEYDDDCLNIIAEINETLKDYNLRIVLLDDKIRDGYEEFKIIELKENNEPNIDPYFGILGI